ncbi:DeoR/GlpR transcriptional regulator [Anaerobacillus sp. CMMVII]|uniref:DeoR/GlpR family DNA-binding transcription regulator n=1 Tax=Anaerobacillus sp. CMMVII TaxID=2755588 RepID=UPI0021B785B7|nr:DeoR/GlpR family DNA-binding transcription regulator [Anaerobacillus sp. CMMVII]MCT8137567.1 DeoR/GlpR transcriptional regulator [Anaerobacillus sp. CMMVII]
MESLHHINERQDRIYRELVNKGEVRISDLTVKFGVVEMTIRRDFEKMEKLGLLKRTYGGAIPITDYYPELNEREGLNSSAKSLIGKKAAEFVKNGDAIFVDAGTTTPYLVKNLPREMELIVVTNAINVATQIQGVNKEKIVIGGILRDATSSLVGPLAEACLENLSFNRVFLSASGFTLEQGFSNANGFEVQIKKLVMRNSKEVNFLIDHSKLGNQFLHKIANLDGSVNRIITDKELPKEYRKIIEEQGIEIVICS